MAESYAAGGLHLKNGQKMRNAKMLGLVVASALAMMLAVPGAASAAQVEPAPPADVAAQIASDPELRYVTVAEAEALYGFDADAEDVPEPAATEPVVTPLWSWWGCDWRGKADYPHVTKNEASVHGYWVKDGGDCPATGTVTVELQALGCSQFGCTWITQATDVAPGVKPGSGTGRWATPHKACANNNLTGWRGRVDTALTDFYDPFGWDDGPAKDLSCSPA
ncbi:Zn-finger domain associated with topoisomerase type I [Microbacterium sp. TS-1]|jgi:hypothetical protein|nr:MULTISPECIES: hypothetical protein [Microbacterium]GAD34527.1 Zn-finger domain associated with topoisomerase type I [Microbacterium sp. TS-1]